MKAVEFESIKGGKYGNFYKIKNWFPWRKQVRRMQRKRREKSEQEEDPG